MFDVGASVLGTPDVVCSLVPKNVERREATRIKKERRSSRERQGYRINFTSRPLVLHKSLHKTLSANCCAGITH